MVKIEKSEYVPLSIRNLCAPSSPQEVNHRLYSGDDVRKQLAADQNNLCAYCGSRINAPYAHIEHYRPKGGYTTAQHPHIHKPGYYWLAYEWSNLLLSCPACNSSFKKNRFDLKDELTRNIRGRDISRENPLLINPVTENPAEFLFFEKYIIRPRVVNGKQNERGQYTIDLLQLNDRADLVSSRKQTWIRHSRLKSIFSIADKVLSRHPEDSNMRAIRQIARMSMERMEAPDAEFSAMFRQAS